MLQAWLFEKSRENRIGYSFLEFAEKQDICANLKSSDMESESILNYLRDSLISDKIDPKLLQSTFQELGLGYVSEHIIATLIPKEKTLQLGDFGEVLTELILEGFCDYCVPVKKRRYAFHGDESLPSHDGLAFKVADNQIKEVCFIESKLRNVSDYKAIGKAYEGLTAKYDTEIPDILIFNLRRMDEMKSPLLLPFKKYLRQRKRDRECDTLLISLVWDIDIWKSSFMKAFNQKDKNVRTVVHLVMVRELRKVVDNVFERVNNYGR